MSSVTIFYAGTCKIMFLGRFGYSHVVICTHSMNVVVCILSILDVYYETYYLLTNDNLVRRTIASYGVLYSIPIDGSALESSFESCAMNLKENIAMKPAARRKTRKIYM